MKKYIWLLVVFVTTIINAQDKKQIVKDSVKTEVVKVVTSYVPKITDAFKIKQKPTISHTKETEKKQLNYQIYSVPVASTFIHKSGSLKKINLGKRERLYANYLSAGFGNMAAPFLEGYFKRSMNYDSELSGYFKFLLSLNPVQNSQLSSTFYNLDFDLNHQQSERYFSWKVGLDLDRDKYNWYGLPTNINFRDRVIDAIEEGQTFGSYKLYGSVDFDESYLDTVHGAVSFFADGFSSSEFNIDLGADFNFSLDRIHRNLNDLSLKTTLNYIGSKFDKAYENQDELKYRFFTAGLNPSYEFILNDLEIRLGAKGYFSLELESNTNHLMVYPDVQLSHPIVKNFANIYVGASGGLYNNSYKNFTDENPFLSPSLNIVQTNEKYNAFAGIRGKMGQQFGYNLKGSYSDIEDMPFFVLNHSKSNGERTTDGNAFILYGYEYGNSFKVVYDNVKLVTISAEATFEGIKDLALSANLQYNQFTLENIEHPWNTPEIKGELAGLYKVSKWYAGANIFFVGDRKGILYENNSAFPYTTVDLESYIDINFNGGYQFHDDFSVFLNLKNVLSNNYQRFTNFQVQGFQAMAGISWKFDTLF